MIYSKWSEFKSSDGCIWSKQILFENVNPQCLKINIRWFLEWMSGIESSSNPFGPFHKTFFPPNSCIRWSKLLNHSKTMIYQHSKVDLHNIKLVLNKNLKNYSILKSKLKRPEHFEHALQSWGFPQNITPSFEICVHNLQVLPKTQRFNSTNFGR